MKYRKKPVVIEAEQLTKESCEDICDWVGDYLYSVDANLKKDTFSIKIKTANGIVKAYDKDWIIKGVMGEFYPCSPAAFKLSYEAAE